MFLISERNVLTKVNTLESLNMRQVNFIRRVQVKRSVSKITDILFVIEHCCNRYAL